MLRHNPENERIKHKYFVFLKDAKQLSEASIDAAAKALARFEEQNNYKSFKTFRPEQASSFKQQLYKRTNIQNGDTLSKATIHSTLKQLKCFFEWLVREDNYKSHIRYSDAEYFNPSRKDAAIATAKRAKKYPTLEQIQHVIAKMPNYTEIERRNRAIIAFTLLTGARDGAIVSAKLGHISLEANSFFQDARQVKTKFSKTFTTFFFQVGDDIKQILVDWIRYLKTQKLYGDHDPLFPMTEMGLNVHNEFAVMGIKPEHWSSASPIREIFKQAFKQAGLEYFNPHSFRNTLVQLGQTRCKTPEAFKAWSQNLGHESVLTTLYSYGEVGRQRQSEIISALSTISDNAKDSDSELAKKIAKVLTEQGIVA